MNGFSLVNVDHYTAVEVLREAGATIILRIVRDNAKNNTFNRVSAFIIFMFGLFTIRTGNYDNFPTEASKNDDSHLVTK